MEIEVVKKSLRHCIDTCDCATCPYPFSRGQSCIPALMANCLEQFGILERNVPKWIPVTKRLPIGADDSGAVCENVCLMMDDGTVSCGWMNGVTKRVYYLNARDDFVIKAPITRVTHWMPLPEPPKEETE